MTKTAAGAGVQKLCLTLTACKCRSTAHQLGDVMNNILRQYCTVYMHLSSRVSSLVHSSDRSLFLLLLFWRPPAHSARFPRHSEKEKSISRTHSQLFSTQSDTPSREGHAHPGSRSTTGAVEVIMEHRIELERRGKEPKEVR